MPDLTAVVVRGKLRFSHQLGGRSATMAAQPNQLNYERRLSQVESTLPHLATKADLAELKAELHKLETRLVRWIAGLGLGVVGTLIAVLIDRFAG